MMLALCSACRNPIGPVYPSMHVGTTNPDLVDQVWELWDAGVITDDLAAWAWSILANQGS